jgi:hypothetical protein
VEPKPNDYLCVRGVIECIELFDDNRTTDLIKDLVDDFLEDITNCDPFVQPHGEGDEYLDMPAFRFDVHSLEVTVNAGYPWGDWAKMLEQNRPDWILYPYNKDELDTDIAADIEAVKEEVEQDDAIPECERLQEVWDRLPDSIQMAVDAGISEEEWRLDGRDGIREALIDAILAFVRDTVDDWDRELKRLKPTGIVLVDKASRTVCGRGARSRRS